MLQELAAIGFSRLPLAFNANGGLLAPADMPPEFMRAIASIKLRSHTPPGKDAQPEYTKEIRLWNKVTALGKLLDLLGLEPEKPNDDGAASGFKPALPPSEALREKWNKVLGRAEGEGEGE